MTSPSDSPSADGLLASLLHAPDRDHVPGARPVVSFRSDDEPEYLDELDRLAPRRVTLDRRGQWHGEWAQLERKDHAGGKPVTSTWFRRWHEARPIVLPGFAHTAPWSSLLGERRRLHDELQEQHGLRHFLGKQKEELEPEFVVHHRPPRPGEDRRDIERVMLHTTTGKLKDLWAKTAWLSNRDDDASLRLRLSFGREVEHDASRDLQRHLAVSDLAARLFPESALVSEHPFVTETLAGFVGGPVCLTQQIAYWNAPGGGALFHHDAFDEPVSGGQRGVLYVQMTGRTAWLALSIEDLARRVIEFGEYLAEGELGWVRARLFPKDEEFERFRKRAGRFKTLVKILGRPGCGELSALVNQGPEFTSLLADAGHAYILEPGDAIVLPNQGLDRTAMHSVFCASEDPGFALSMAIRELDPQPEPEPEPEPERENGEIEREVRREPGPRPASSRRGRRGGSRRGRRGGRGRP